MHACMQAAASAQLPLLHALPQLATCHQPYSTGQSTRRFSLQAVGDAVANALSSGRFGRKAEVPMEHIATCLRSHGLWPPPQGVAAGRLIAALKADHRLAVTRCTQPKSSTTYVCLRITRPTQGQPQPQGQPQGQAQAQRHGRSSRAAAGKVQAQAASRASEGNDPSPATSTHVHACAETQARTLLLGESASSMLVHPVQGVLQLLSSRHEALAPITNVPQPRHAAQTSTSTNGAFSRPTSTSASMLASSAAQSGSTCATTARSSGTPIDAAACTNGAPVASRCGVALWLSHASRCRACGGCRSRRFCALRLLRPCSAGEGHAERLACAQAGAPAATQAAPAAAAGA